MCGLVPALVSMKAEVLDALRDGSLAAGYGRQQHRLRGLLVVAEAALAMLLLVGSGPLLRSFVRMLNINPGFQPEHVMTASLALPEEGYLTQENVDEFLANLECKIEVIPGVQAVGFSTDIPIIGRNSSRPFSAQDYVPKPNEVIALAANYLVKGDYFGALRIPLIEGRYFTAADDQPNATRNHHRPIVCKEILSWPGSCRHGHQGGSEFPKSNADHSCRRSGRRRQ
jgi:hypothetical protein